MIEDNAVILLISTNIEDDDISSIISNLEYRDKIFLVTDIDTAADTSGMIHIVDDFQDMDRSIGNIRRILENAGKKAVCIIGLDEEHHYRISLKIAESLSIRYYDRKVLDMASNKYLQKRAFSEKGLRIPKYLLLDIDKPIPEKEVKTIGFPNVLKPLTGYASFNVYVNDDKDMLKRNISSVSNSVKDITNPDSVVFDTHRFIDSEGKESYINPGKYFILEEYISGDEYSCDFIINNGTVDILRVVKKIPDLEIGEFNGFILFNPDGKEISGFDTEMLRVECIKIASAFNIEEGVCMVDFKFYNDEIVILESTVRPGIATFIELMGILYGYTSIDMLIRQKLGFYTAVEMPETVGASLFIVTKSLGEIKHFDTSKISDISNIEVLHVSKYHDVGDIITEYDYDGGVKLLGYVLLKVLLKNYLNSLFYDVNKMSIIRIE